MKRVLLALTIGFIAMGCRNFEKGEPDTLQEDIYEGRFVEEYFCGNLLHVDRINGEVPDEYRKAIKILNLPNNSQQNLKNIPLTLTLKNLKSNDHFIFCGGFLGYTYEAEIKKIINIKNQ